MTPPGQQHIRSVHLTHSHDPLPHRLAGPLRLATGGRPAMVHRHAPRALAVGPAHTAHPVFPVVGWPGVRAPPRPPPLGPPRGPRGTGPAAGRPDLPDRHW